MSIEAFAKTDAASPESDAEQALYLQKRIASIAKEPLKCKVIV